MADTYTATLDSGDSTETVELELIAGEPQKSFLRTVNVNGEDVEEVWELDADAPGHTYRRGGYPERDYS
jgi:hypothetical protein